MKTYHVGCNRIYVNIIISVRQARAKRNIKEKQASKLAGAGVCLFTFRCYLATWPLKTLNDVSLMHHYA